MSTSSKYTSWHWMAIASTLSVVVAIGLFYILNMTLDSKREELIKEVDMHATYSAVDEYTVGMVQKSCDLFNKNIRDIEEQLQQTELALMPHNKEDSSGVVDTVNEQLYEHGLTSITYTEINKVVQNDGKTKSRTRSRRSSNKVQTKYKTTEYQFSVQGRYQQFFMFLYSQSTKLHSYHISRVKINNSIEGVKMSFILHVNYKG